MVDLVRCLDGVCNLEVQNTVDLDLDVVLGDSGLGVDGEDLFLQVVMVADKIDEGPLEAEAGLEDLDEAAEALKDHYVLLGDKDEGGEKL
jgi:hypothetical protein